MTTYRPPRGRAVLRRCVCGAEVLVGRDPLDDREVIAVDNAFLDVVAEAQHHLAGRQVYELAFDHEAHSWLAIRSLQGARRRVLALEPPQRVMAGHVCARSSA